jgi:hypothetical protein
VMAIVGGREMRDGRVSLRERDGSQADVPLAEAVSRLQAMARPGTLVAEALQNLPQARADRWIPNLPGVGAAPADAGSSASRP